MAEIEAIAKLVNQLSKLPGVGRKTAQRLAYHIIALPEDQVRELAVAIFNGKKQIHFCPICGNYTDTDPCPICADSSRRKDIVCVVRDPRDSRLASGEIKEVVLATNPDVEGEATAAYISRLIKPMGVKVTRIAHGVPIGGELEYTDEVTLLRAFQGRREI